MKPFEFRSVFSSMVNSLATAALAAALQSPAPKEAAVKPQVVSVSMFKNGYCFVTRKIEMRSGTAKIVEVPRASLGTLWFWTPDGEITSIATATDLSTTEKEVGHETFSAILIANAGKSVEVEYLDTNGKEARLIAEIKSVGAEVAIFSKSNGDVTAIPKSAIRKISSSDKSFSWTSKVPQQSADRYYRVNASGNTKEVMMMSLERGMTWAPGYALDITHPTRLKVVAKATLLNDSLSFENVPLRLITGFPNMQFKDILDPFTSGLSVDEWINSLSNGGGVRAPRGGAAMMTQNAAAYRVAEADSVNWGGADASETSGEELGDLFFYDLKARSMKSGSRAYENLFQFETDYKHVYTWDVQPAISDTQYSQSYQRPVPAPASEQVWHTIRFTNTAKQPLTTAVTTIFNKSEMVGQTMSNYCPAAGECSVRINQSLDILPESIEEEISRDRGAIKGEHNVSRFDLVTVKGTLMIRNTKATPIEMRITKEITGEITSSTGSPEITKTTRGLQQMNPATKLVWKPTVKAKDRLTLEYRYQLYVPST